MPDGDRSQAQSRKQRQPDLVRDAGCLILFVCGCYGKHHEPLADRAPDSRGNGVPDHCDHGAGNGAVDQSSHTAATGC